MKTNFFIKIILQKRLSYICSVTKKQKNVVPRNEQSHFHPPFARIIEQSYLDRETKGERERKIKKKEENSYDHGRKPSNSA